ATKLQGDCGVVPRCRASGLGRLATLSHPEGVEPRSPCNVRTPRGCRTPPGMVCPLAPSGSGRQSLASMTRVVTIRTEHEDMAAAVEALAPHVSESSISLTTHEAI